MLFKEKIIDRFKITSDIYWSFDDKRIYHNDRYIKLSRNEINFLELLLKFPNRVFSDEEIINHVWIDRMKNISSYSVKNLIKNLRKKLPCDIIENYYGVGYKLISSQKIVQNKIDFIDVIKSITTIIERAKSSKELIKNVLDETLKSFECDRVFLLYPLSIQTKTFEILYEAVNPKYPGAVDLNTKVDMTDEQIVFFNRVINSKEPISIGKNELKNVKSYSVNLAESNFIPPKSNLVWKIKPVIGDTWGIGLHQCSYERIWNEIEIELFKDIALRLRDALSILLFYEDKEKKKNLQEENLNTQMEQIQNFFTQNKKIPIINEVIKNISHQLSQPFSILSLIVGRIDLKLKQLGVEDRDLKESLSLIDIEIKEIWGNIQKFDNLFKQNHQKENFYISRAILEVKSLVIDSFLNDGIEFHIDINDDYKIENYLNDFKQVIYYILINTKQVVLNDDNSKKIIKISLEKENRNFFIKISNSANFNKEITKIYPSKAISKQMDKLSIFLSKVMIEKSLNGELFIRNHSNDMEFIIKIKGE